MRVWPTFMLLVLLAKASKDPTDIVRNIPKRYSEDWRLFCNVCNHFIWRVGDNLSKSIQTGDEHDFESRTGFRLDANGKKHNLKQKSVDIKRSVFLITEVMDEDICAALKVDAVLYNKTSKKKEGLRILLKDQKYKKTKDLGRSKKRKYVGKANLYCAEVYQRYYDEVIEVFMSEKMGSRKSFCSDYVDSRCPLVTELPEVVFKSKNATKSKKDRGNKNTSGDLNKKHHNETNTTSDFSTKAEVLEETKSREENELQRQPPEEKTPERGEQRLSAESDKPQESEKHNEL